MIDPAKLIQQHAEAIITTLLDALDASDPRARLEAAKLLLLWGWGEPDDRRVREAIPAGGPSYAEQQRAVEVLLPHLRPGRKPPNRAATSCPARHGDIPAPAASAPVLPPLAAPVDAESPRGDADPMSRRLLPVSHSADDVFRRPLPLPPSVEPPGFYASEYAAEPRKRGPPWR